MTLCVTTMFTLHTPIIFLRARAAMILLMVSLITSTPVTQSPNTVREF